jgi:pimeloyl-ACP methyl ester carboxylesterase
METVNTYVLVHGGWHGAWCWNRVVSLLEDAGQKVVARDLPGHGADPIPLAARPFELYVPSLCKVLEELERQAILVGHSSGGMIITEAAARLPFRVKGLVYLSAFLLPPGQTPLQVMQFDTESILRSSLVIDNAKGVSTVSRDLARSVFYGDCAEADAEWAISQLQPEPLIPRVLPASAPPAAATQTGIPRFYIECLQDRALGPKTQKWMYTESPCDAVYSLPTSHSPFLSAPASVTECLLGIGRKLDRTAAPEVAPSS